MMTKVNCNEVVTNNGGILSLVNYEVSNIKGKEAIKYYSETVQVAYKKLTELREQLSEIRVLEITATAKEKLVKELFAKNSDNDHLASFMFNLYCNSKEWTVPVLVKKELRLVIRENEEQDGFINSCVFTEAYIDMNGDVKTVLDRKPLFIEYPTKQEVRILESHLEGIKDKNKFLISEMLINFNILKKESNGDYSQMFNNIESNTKEHLLKMDNYAQLLVRGVL